MYLNKRAISNVTAHSIPASFSTNASAVGRNLLQSALDYVLQYLQICFRWTARQSRQAIVALWQALRIADILHFILRVTFRILWWCAFVLATIISVTIIVNIGYWVLPKLWEIYNKSRKRRLRERRQIEEREQREAFLSELRAKQAADAAAKEEARLQQAREDEAIKNKLERDEEKRKSIAKAAYIRWETKCNQVFQDRASMTELPFPPLLRCTTLDCEAFLKSPVPACPHNVKQFLRESGFFSLELLKRQKHLWHPDRFRSCREELRPDFSLRANSLFVIMDPWYKELKENSSTVRYGGEVGE